MYGTIKKILKKKNNTLYTKWAVTDLILSLCWFYFGKLHYIPRIIYNTLLYDLKLVCIIIHTIYIVWLFYFEFIWNFFNIIIIPYSLFYNTIYICMYIWLYIVYLFEVPWKLCRDQRSSDMVPTHPSNAWCENPMDKITKTVCNNLCLSDLLHGFLAKSHLS